jgi:hypothetical protein
MKKFISILALGLVFSTVQAQEYEPVPISWNMPTENEDGSAIPASGTGALSSTSIEYSVCENGQVVEPKGHIFVPVPNTTSEHVPTDAATHCYQATVANTEGVSSNYSNVASKTPVPIIPPTGDLMTSDTKVFWLLETSEKNRLALEEVGRINLSVPCDESIRVDAHYWPVGSSDQIVTTYRVDVANVAEWYASSSYSVVTAFCTKN